MTSDDSFLLFFFFFHVFGGSASSRRHVVSGLSAVARRGVPVLPRIAAQGRCAQCRRCRRAEAMGPFPGLNAT